LQIEGLDLWVNFDAEGKSNFRNLHIPPPEPNQRILFAYSTAHVELKNAHVYYGDKFHSLSGERATFTLRFNLTIQTRRQPVG